MIGLKQKWKGLVLCLAIALPSWFLGKIFPIVAWSSQDSSGTRNIWNRESNLHQRKYFNGPSYFLDLG